LPAISAPHISHSVISLRKLVSYAPGSLYMGGGRNKYGRGKHESKQW
jgi:hypothetical protein